MTNRRFTLTLTELLPGGMKREVRNAFEIPDTNPDIERDIKLHAKAALPEAINLLASTKGFIEEDRFTPQWNAIADQLKDIAIKHGPTGVFVIPEAEVTSLLAALLDPTGNNVRMVREFFYGNGE